MNWYYAIGGRSQGPLTEVSLKQLACEGAIFPDTLVWHPGLEEWEPLAKLKPEFVERGSEGAVARPPDTEPGRIPLLEQTGTHGAETGLIKRLFGWGKKKPQ